MSDAPQIRIVGGGLAGLSLGIALSRAGVRSEIFEAGEYPRHRVCGEFITGLDDRIIDQLGIRTAFAGACTHRTATWYRHGEQVGRQVLPEPARGISRHALDARLAKIFVAEGGTLTTRTRLQTPGPQAGWIETNGRTSRGTSLWLGLKVHARKLPAADGLELHLGDGAYVGLAAVEDGWINICGLFRRRAGLRWKRDQVLVAYLKASGLAELAERVAAAEIRSGSASAVAGLAFARRVRTDHRVRLGDAAGMIPPFTGDGMAMAFTGAALALEPLVAWTRQEQSWPETVRAIGDALRREFRLRLVTAALVHPFLLHPMLQRGVGAAACAGLVPFAPLYRWLH